MKITKAVIPLAGLATRFLPGTKSIPKEILPIGPYPIIHWVVRELFQTGINYFLLITNNRNQVFENYFSKDPWLEKKIISRPSINEKLKDLNTILQKCRFSYVHQTKPTGLADAILSAKDFVGNDSFFCHMGDSFITNGDLCRKMVNNHLKYSASITLAVKQMSVKQLRKVAYVIPEEDLSEAVFSFKKYIEKSEDENISEINGTIGRYIFSSDIFNTLESLIQQNKIQKEKDYGKAINEMLRKHIGLAIEMNKNQHLYSAGELDDYYKCIIHFCDNENVSDYLH